MTLQSQYENCQLANQGLEREIGNLTNAERRAQDDLRKCQLALSTGGSDGRNAELAD